MIGCRAHYQLRNITRCKYESHEVSWKSLTDNHKNGEELNCRIHPFRALRPITPETNQAWEITTEMYNQWKEENHDTDAAFQNSRSRLMERASASRARKIVSLKAPRDDRTSLPVPRSIIQEHHSVAAAAADLDVQHSSMPGTARIDDLLDDEFKFSAIDWLSAPLM